MTFAGPKEVIDLAVGSQQNQPCGEGGNRALKFRVPRHLIHSILGHSKATAPDVARRARGTKPVIVTRRSLRTENLQAHGAQHSGSKQKSFAVGGTWTLPHLYGRRRFPSFFLNPCNPRSGRLPRAKRISEQKPTPADGKPTIPLFRQQIQASSTVFPILM